MTKKSPVSPPSPDHTQPKEAPALVASVDSPPVRMPEAPLPTGVPLATLRDLRFYSRDRVSAKGQTIPGNGFAPAFLKLGRAVYVDVATFRAIWRSKQQESAGGGREK
jgi:hypothetical protein